MDVYNNDKHSKFLFLVFTYVQVSQEISACQKLDLPLQRVLVNPVVLKANNNCFKISQRGYFMSVDESPISTVKRE